MAKIHHSAIVEDGAQLGADVEIGPFCHVGPRAKLGDGVRLGSHVAIIGNTELGAECIVHPHAVLGGPAQYRGDPGADVRVVVGAKTVFREYVTVNSGTTKGGGVTSVGERGFYMANSHIAHDCHVGNNVTFANSVALGGHVHIGDDVTIGGLAAVHQFGRVGRGAMLGGLSAARGDVIPFGIAIGDVAALAGLNLIGLKRRNLPRERIHAIRAAYRAIFFGPGRLFDRAAAAAEKWKDVPEIREITDFILLDSKRSICVPRARGLAAEEE